MTNDERQMFALVRWVHESEQVSVLARGSHEELRLLAERLSAVDVFQLNGRLHTSDDCGLTIDLLIGDRIVATWGVVADEDVAGCLQTYGGQQ